MKKQKKIGYTPVGYITFSQDLVDTVEDNPVVPVWGNKMVHISAK